MKATTRDNLIYLGVGLGIVALLVADIFIADSHGRNAWIPSKFAFLSVFTTPFLLFHVAKYIRTYVTLPLVRLMGCVVMAGVLHLAILFYFHDSVNELPGLTLSSLVVLELYAVFCAVTAIAPYFKPSRHKKHTRANRD